MAIALTLSYNLGHNILELYNILVQVRFTTSKTKLDIWYSKLSIRVASRVAEQRPLGGGGLCAHTRKKKDLDLRKLENIREISNLGGHISQRPVPPHNSRIRQQHSQYTEKQILNSSFPVQLYPISPSHCKYPVRDCSQLGPNPLLELMTLIK